MSTDIEQVLRILDYRGITLNTSGGRLRARSMHGRVPDDMRALITRHRDAIVAALQERERLAETVTNVLALPDAEYRQWVADVTTAPADDPNLAHDRAALREVAYRKRLADESHEEPAA